MKEIRGGLNQLTFAGILITLGIVYGDIGTSPLYVMQAIVAGIRSVKPDVIYGAVSCIIWTLTFQTTLKYVIITLRADNKGEGGIFALFALIRRRKTYGYLFAIIGGSALLADGIITPSITVTSAIEGLQYINHKIPVLFIVFFIITLLFIIQQFGTQFIGNSYGPVMSVWFLMLGLFGFAGILQYPDILNSFNPVYAYRLLSEYPGGFLLLGAVFLATTGAEALYSDLGHCGLKNIRVSWIFVKSMLILNYLGQGAWVITHSFLAKEGHNPFYMLMPSWFLMSGVLISAAAAIIASQAMISGTFTLMTEAFSLNFWPKLKVKYPTEVRGQVYVPRINWFLWLACMFVVWFFQESSRMQAAYGLAISITMLMTTILLTIYLRNRVPYPILLLFAGTFFLIEGAFLTANLHKFLYGAYFTILMAGFFCTVMYVWYNARKIRNRYLNFVKIDEYFEILTALSNDLSVPKYATNLAYLTKANKKTEVESYVIYSILNKKPKRADVYWFLHVDIMDSPDTFEYEVTTYVPGKIIKVDFRVGFKIEPRVSQYFRQILEDLSLNGEADILSRYESLRKHNVNADFKFVLIDRIATYDLDLNFRQKLIMDMYNVIKYIGLPEEKGFYLDTSNVYVEKVPLAGDQKLNLKIRRLEVEE